MALQQEIEAVMTKYGFDFDLREPQKEAIASILGEKNTFVSLPTGFGKSMCYILPPLIKTARKQLQSTAIVVTPMKTIMQDQKEKLKEKKIKVAVLLNREEMEAEDETAVKSGEVDIIFTTPEAANAWLRTLSGDLLQVLLLLLLLLQTS